MSVLDIEVHSGLAIFRSPSLRLSSRCEAPDVTVEDVTAGRFLKEHGCVGQEKGFGGPSEDRRCWQDGEHAR